MRQIILATLLAVTTAVAAQETTRPSAPPADCSCGACEEK
jgi:hypothetical protein